MKMLKRCQLYTLLMVNLLTINAWSNTLLENVYKHDANVITSAQPLDDNIKQYSTESFGSPVQNQLDKAKKSGKAVFVVVTGKGAPNEDKAMSIAKAAKEIYKNSIVIKLNRDDSANASLVSEWRLTGAPLPLILVVSTKGMLTGGEMLDRATPESIASLVPSPKLEKVQEAISNGKHSIVAFTKKADRSEVIKECNKAVATLGNTAVFIEVDMGSAQEMSFMKKMQINPQTANSSVTLVINNKGQVAGTSKTIPEASKLVAAARKPVKSGCGPGCGPAGCGK